MLRAIAACRAGSSVFAAVARPAAASGAVTDQRQPQPQPQPPYWPPLLRAFAASRPDLPTSVTTEHGDFSSAQSQVQQPGKERPPAGDAAELRARAEAEMGGRDNVVAEGARVMGAAHLQDARAPPQLNPRGASGGITSQHASSSSSSSSGSSGNTLRESDPSAPTGPGFGGDGTSAAAAVGGGGIGDGLSADSMNSTDAGEDMELMKGRLAELEKGPGGGGAGEGSGNSAPPQTRPGQTPMSP